MEDLIQQTMAVLASSATLVKDPIINESVKELFSWMKTKLGNTAKRKVEILENDDSDRKVLDSLAGIMEDKLYENVVLQNELKELIEKIPSEKQPGTIPKSNKIRIKKSKKSTFYQDVQISGNGKLNN